MSESCLLLDTGPLVAYFNARDPHHEWARDTINRLSPPLVTCEPVLTEAFYLLSKTHNGVDLLAAFCGGAVLQVELRVLDEVKALRDLLRKYRNVPMDLADACLVHIAEGYKRPVIITLDKDFLVYRTRTRRQIPLMAPFTLEN